MLHEFVLPKVPKDFPETTMAKKSYLIAPAFSSYANTTSFSIGIKRLLAPHELEGHLADVFGKQEDERYRMKLRHQVERVRPPSDRCSTSPCCPSGQAGSIARTRNLASVRQRHAFLGQPRYSIQLLLAAQRQRGLQQPVDTVARETPEQRLHQYRTEQAR